MLRVLTWQYALLVESEQPSAYDKKSAEDNGWSIHAIPIAENHAPSLEQIHDFVMRLTRLPKGTKVLVFCHSGKGRTACMGAAILDCERPYRKPRNLSRVSDAVFGDRLANPEAPARFLHEYERLQPRL